MYSPTQHAFDDPDAVAHYADGPRRIVPGYHALHAMAGILLAERAPTDARVLILGAGGGLETKALAEAFPQWTFDGVDPSAEMLALAERTLGPLATRSRLHRGVIDDAPDGPFDAAVCLLTLHFLDDDQRRRTVEQVRARLRPGAPFVVAHFSIPGSDHNTWLDRYAAFAITSGVDPETITRARSTLTTQVHIMSPEQDRAVLTDAGFTDVTEFYCAFTFRGWVAYA
ncbi:MAG: class I SAM-dependent methyltransferase [Mycobacterium sp.]